MKQIVCLGLLISVVAACAGASLDKRFGSNPEYLVWKAIDAAYLTQQQKDALQSFDETKPLGNLDRSLLAEYPWIDTKNLTDRDKLFLIPRAQAMLDAIMYFTGP